MLVLERRMFISQVSNPLMVAMKKKGENQTQSKQKRGNNKYKSRKDEIGHRNNRKINL